MAKQRERVVLAYSGGLDTSFSIPFLMEEYGYDVLTVTVDTGGFQEGELEAIEARARSLGSVGHFTVDGRSEVYDRYVTHLIRGNILRGEVYPLSVAAERIVQAEVTARVARREGASAVAHGSTVAGNDQVRFDIAFRVLVPDLRVIAPIREHRLTRKEEYEYLRARGVEIGEKVGTYSVNVGLWGTTVGGGETHDPWAEIPESVFPAGAAGPAATTNVAVGFQEGLPVSLDGKPLDGVTVVRALGELSMRYRAGIGIHIGDTVVGIKGRIAFQAGAALMLIAAHRELEKITTTQWQRFWKDHLAEFYGKMLHEGNVFDPVMRDIEALIERSQGRVTGEARILVQDRGFQVTGVRSPHSMMAVEGVRYGEEATGWTAEDVAGFSKITSVPSMLHRMAGEDTGEGGHGR